MDKKKFLLCWGLITLALLAGALLVPASGGGEAIQPAMRDAVLHSEGRIDLFGLKDVNPAFISAMAVSGTLLLAADTIAKTVAATELPVSIFTSLLGVPFLLYLIIKPGRETR